MFPPPLHRRRIVRPGHPEARGAPFRAAAPSSVRLPRFGVPAGRSDGTGPASGNGVASGSSGSTGASPTSLPVNSAARIPGTLMQPTAGSPTMLGVDPTTADDRALTAFRSRHIGFVFQFHNLLPDVTVPENVIFPTAVREGLETG